MFIGYEIKKGQNASKPMTLTTDIKLSQAVLDPASKSANNKDPVCLVAEFNKKQFIIAVLDPNLSWQTPLDLMLAAGTEVKFFVRGSGTVHLTGYEAPDDFDDLSMSMSSDEDIEDEESDEPEPVKKIKTGSAKKSPKTNGVSKNAKKNGKPLQAGDVLDDNADLADTDSDDDDFDEADLEDDDDDDLDESDDDEVGIDDSDDEEMDEDDDESDE